MLLFDITVKFFFTFTNILSSSSINCLEWDVEVPNYNCGFVYFSFQLYQFLFIVFCVCVCVCVCACVCVCVRAALGLCCGARASHCGGFSCCGAWALGCMGFSSCSRQAQ